MPRGVAQWVVSHVFIVHDYFIPTTKRKRDFFLVGSLEVGRSILHLNLLSGKMNLKSRPHLLPATYIKDMEKESFGSLSAFLALTVKFILSLVLETISLGFQNILKTS